MRSFQTVEGHIFLITISAGFYLDTDWVLFQLILMKFFVNRGLVTLISFWLR